MVDSKGPPSSSANPSRSKLGLAADMNYRFFNKIQFCLMRYSLHEIDKHHVVATTVAVDRDEALEWFSEKLRLMLTFEGDPVAADYLLDERPEGLPFMAHTPNPTIPVFIVIAVAAHPQAS